MLLVESITVGVVFSLIGALLTFPVGMLVGSMVPTIMISYSITPVIIGTLLCTIVTVLASLSPARSAPAHLAHWRNERTPTAKSASPVRSARSSVYSSPSVAWSLL